MTSAPRVASAMLRPGEIFDPVARALDALGDRWTLGLVRQLLVGPTGFQELRKKTGITPRVLSARLRQLAADGLVEAVTLEGRSQYAVTDRGRSLEGVIVALGRWWIQDGISDLGIDAERFTETSAQSILESLPLMLREDASAEARVTFEVRLTGEGGGAWSVRIEEGSCDVHAGFASHADVRYTADARDWCGLALGLLEARDLFESGALVKEGGPEAMDRYFHQVAMRNETPEEPLPTRSAANTLDRTGPAHEGGVASDASSNQE